MNARQEKDIRDRIAAAGGVVNAADLARAWGVSRERVRQLAQEPGFPAPLEPVGERPVWLRAVCDAWREARRH